MCIGCWEDQDSPTDWSPQIARAVLLWHRLYNDLMQPTGGPLHAELDDCNLDYDEFVPRYSLRASGGRPATADGYPPEVHEVCDELAALLTAMTLPERYATMAYADGYITPPGMMEEPIGDVEERVISDPTGRRRDVRLTHLPTGIRTFGVSWTSVEEAQEKAVRGMRMRLHLEALDSGARS